MQRCAFMLFLMLIAMQLFSYDFPAPGGTVSASFGSEKMGQLNTGIDIKTDSVYASEDGELLYLGQDMVAIIHASSIVTLYSQVSPLPELSKDFRIKRGQRLGSTTGGVLHFSIYDLEMERYIHPLLMTERVKPSELPKVQAVSYEAGEGLLSVQLASKGLSGLYRLEISVDGQVVQTLGFRSISRKNEALVLDNGGSSADVLYCRQGAFSFKGLQLKGGVNEVNVIITDFYGKKVVFHGRITV